MGLVVVMAASAGGWYYADELLLVRPGPVERPVEIVAVTASTVVLRGEGADQPGIVGLDWDGGYARLGPGITMTPEGVVREFTPYPDTPVAGTPARVDNYASPLDLASVAELAVEDVVFAGPLGEYPATRVPADGSRWVLHVHGRGGSRAEGFRLVPAIHHLGHPQLAISYRNDDDAPADPRGEFGLGSTESADLAAAVRYARANGARDVVLVGYSMGAAVIGHYLRTVGSAGIAGVVYDSPALSWPDILAYQARDRGLPEAAGALASAVVRLRSRIDLARLDQVNHADEFDVPMLLVHGSGDATVPVTSSDAFARARPDLVTYVRPDGVGHVQGWNTDPAGYENAVAAFLSALH
jgi:pimeloyl-ACP methyl ester carboxylesterase